jgi:hypothetical protein
MRQLAPGFRFGQSGYTPVHEPQTLLHFHHRKKNGRMRAGHANVPFCDMMFMHLDFLFLEAGMTTLFRETKTCFVCGNKSEHTAIGSTNSFGSPDLDLRPPEMQRSTMPHWIQRCPTCGYCAASIAEGPEIAKEIVRSPDYLAQRDDPAFPWLADNFLCSSLIQAADSKESAAGWDALHAAWTCDDQAAEKAEFCRRKAIVLFIAARAKGQPFAKERTTEDLLLADLYRRSTQFDEVEGVCANGLAQRPHQLMAVVFLAQRQLARGRDSKRYTVADAQKLVPESAPEQP